MPAPGKLWRHVVISTLNSWLPGDERGWRSRRHKRHSSGDYRNPPPESEHAGLRRYVKSISGESVAIPRELRRRVGEALIEKLTEGGHRVLAVAVGRMHAHVLVELPNDMTLIRRIIGDAKNLASRRVRKEMPGRLWAGGGAYKAVLDRDHQTRVYRYIRNHMREGAWVWTFRDGVVQG